MRVRPPRLSAVPARLALATAAVLALAIGTVSAQGATAATPSPEPTDAFTVETTTAPSTIDASPAPTATPTPTVSATPSPTPSASPMPTADPTATPSPTPTSLTQEEMDRIAGDSTLDEAVVEEGAQVRTDAMSLVGFDPGNIISDAVFYNSGAMTAAQIQTFLKGKVPACQSGYVCLKDYKTRTTDRAADSYCTKPYQGAASETAATIIAKVAKACGINPQVLLVMLQKEQGLVTHTWPSDWRYTIAMGMACPDTSACDTAYYGFQNQVYGAARQYQIYAKASWFTWFPVGKSSQVRYHPNASCGSSAVTIKNKATASLYYYTPYQPNAAALKAGYGTGDSCSAYGNRNFYNYFTDWFGSTRTPAKPAVVNHDPVGGVDSWKATSTGVTISGWATDPDTSGAVTLRIKVGDRVTRVTADDAHSSKGAHGFRVTVPLAPRSQEVCVAANNIGKGSNRTISCRTVSPAGGTPTGKLDPVAAVPGGVRISGWALDPDTSDAVTLRVKVDGAVVARLNAGGSRPGVNSLYPGYGTRHGYSSTLQVGAGAHEVCVVANNVGAGTTKTLGCQAVEVLAGTPIGYLNSWTPTASGVHIAGWAIDPDTTSPVTIRVKVGSTVVARFAADTSRSDLAGRFPGYGAAHAFYDEIALPTGSHEVCVVANNVADGRTKTLGCRTVERLGDSPIGHVDSWRTVAGGVTVRGWTIDPSTRGTVTVRAKADGAVVRRFGASAVRADVGAAYPYYGARHGFEVTIPLASGTREVCLAANDIGAGNNRTLGCRTVTVP
ncbi:hypothetical protein [Microbacterium sp. NPDC055683]